MCSRKPGGGQCGLGALTDQACLQLRCSGHLSWQKAAHGTWGDRWLRLLWPVKAQPLGFSSFSSIPCHFMTRRLILRAPFAERKLVPPSAQFTRIEVATMPRVKQASKQKRTTKAAAVKVLGAAGLGLSLASSASASTMPAAGIPQSDNTSPNQRFVLGEEEMADVSLATFHLFDKENGKSAVQQMAWGCRCGACRACGAWRGCRCGGCGGCGGCCARWGRCRWC